MTDDRMVLVELIEHGANGDVVREMLAFAAERMMDMEIEARMGAAMGSRSPVRINHRNGYREQGWDTRVGRIDLAIPKLRKGNCFPNFLDPRRTAEKALAAVIEEAYVHGVSTRSVDERMSAFLTRPIEGEWPCLWIDATYLEVREGGWIVSTAVIIAVGVSTDGRREILGIATGPSVAEPFWKAFLRSLADRGLRGVKLDASKNSGV